MLRIEGLVSGYTRVAVLQGIALTVPAQAIVGVLGANGAGKTALLRAISALNPVHAGHIEFNGESLTASTADAVVRRGVIQVPQGRMLFGAMSVRENLELGAYLQNDRHVIDERLELVCTMFPVLKERTRQAAAYLSGGEQQMLAIGRALMGNPKLLLLDEPSLGLAPKVFDAILDRIGDIHRAGASILIAEQNARKVLRLASYCYVLENGSVALHGPADVLARDARIEKSYLGAAH
ncbi:MAG: ABC transporter ATP-binding protein [Burkholderiaceae bacterium]